MGYPTDERGRRAPTPSALAALVPMQDGFRVLPDPLRGQPLLRIPARHADVRVVLDRSYESAQAGEPTQDYLAVRCEPRRLSFAVTDGVGSSFLGDVAAQILAIRLADWFASGPGGDQVASALDRYLHQLATDEIERIANWPIADSVPALIRSALDQQRAYGSEAMFVAGTVDLTGRREAAATVAWLGDARLRVITRDGRTLDHSGQTTDRWSSRLGPRGAVQSRTWPVVDVARVVACTDGLIPALDSAIELSDTALQEVLHQQARRPGNDDMALVDIGLAPRAMPAGDGAANSTLWRRLAEEPQRRHARPTPAGSALRRVIRAVGPVTSLGIPTAAAGTEPTGDATADPTVTDHSATDHSATAYAEPPAPEPPSTLEPAAPTGVEPPAPIGWRRVDRGRELNWAPVPGADSYAVQLCREKTFAEPLLYSVPRPSFLVPPMGAPLFGRVRSVAGGEPGPWGPVYDFSERPAEPGAS